MKRTALFAFVFAGVVGLSSIAALAVPFDPVFKLTKIVGECTVMEPGAASFVPAQEGKAYPYGTKVKTGRKSLADVVVQIEFTENRAGAPVNVCRVLANTTLTVSEDIKDSKIKNLKLEDGRIDIELDEKFHEENALNVETATAICGAIGCKFSITSATENDMKVVVFACEDGKLHVYGTGFDLPLLEKDDAVSIAKAIERAFVRIKNIKGNFEVTVKDAEGNPKNLEVKLGYSVKVWEETTDKGTLVLVLFINPEEKIEQTFSYTMPTPPGGPDDKPKTPDDGKVTDEGEIQPLPTTTVTTITATTTTLSASDAAVLGEVIPAGSQTTATTTTTTSQKTTTTTTPSVTPVGNL